mmetsp:Transcript_30885/g.98506  ORF Transcript_30885/g.98506 Transcript_30885/m.98506 type:complete len:313 (+) Transcript_30885:521-1459(+)
MSSRARGPAPPRSPSLAPPPAPAGAARCRASCFESASATRRSASQCKPAIKEVSTMPSAPCDVAWRQIGAVTSQSARTSAKAAGKASSATSRPSAPPRGRRKASGWALPREGAASGQRSASPPPSEPGAPPRRTSAAKLAHAARRKGSPRSRKKREARRWQRSRTSSIVASAKRSCRSVRQLLQKPRGPRLPLASSTRAVDVYVCVSSGVLALGALSSRNSRSQRGGGGSPCSGTATEEWPQQAVGRAEAGPSAAASLTQLCSPQLHGKSQGRPVKYSTFSAQPQKVSQHVRPRNPQPLCAGFGAQRAKSPW